MPPSQVNDSNEFLFLGPESLLSCTCTQYKLGSDLIPSSFIAHDTVSSKSLTTCIPFFKLLSSTGKANFSTRNRSDDGPGIVSS